jgi:hypothetical protein
MIIVDLPLMLILSISFLVSSFARNFVNPLDPIVSLDSSFHETKDWAKSGSSLVVGFPSPPTLNCAIVIELAVFQIASVMNEVSASTVSTLRP